MYLLHHSEDPGRFPKRSDGASCKRSREDLAEQGVKELILVAQETTLYGKDLYGEKSLHRPAAGTVQDRRDPMDTGALLLSGGD